jgi:hypothetical protein
MYEYLANYKKIFQKMNTKFDLIFRLDRADNFENCGQMLPMLSLINSHSLLKNGQVPVQIQS